MNTNEVKLYRLSVERRFSAPFRPDVVHWRPGATTRDKTRAVALAYIDARDVMERLDEVVGPWCWQRHHDVSHTICRLGVLIPFEHHDRVEWEWIWKTDVSGETSIEAEKGGASRALVRAAVNFGIGRYLYDLPSPWMDYDEDRKRFADGVEDKLKAALQRRYDEWKEANPDG